MSRQLQEAIAQLQSERDLRVVREREDIKIDTDEYDKTIFQLGDLSTLTPTTFQVAQELSDLLTSVMHAMDKLYSELRETETITDKTYSKLIDVRDAMMQQFCCTDPTMLENYRFLEGATEHHFRFDILCFLALLETVGCLSAVPAFWESLGENEKYDDGVVPMIAFPELCRKTIISRNLHDKPLTEFNVFDIVEALKYLEFKWCVIKYSPELPIYLDLLLSRIATLYKNPQPYIVFTNIDDYMKKTDDKHAVFSDRMIEELCWSLRPMYQKVSIHNWLAKKTAVFQVPDSDWKRVQQLSSDNSRRMNNKKVSEDFRRVYMRFAIRPSELQRFYRDKRGAYGNAALVMKNTRSGESVNKIMDKLDNPAWEMVDRECSAKVRTSEKRKGILDTVATDIMYVMLLDSWLGNLWQVEWAKVFVIYNLDMLEQGDDETRFRVDYPLLVQSFNHFDVYHLGMLYEHNGIAKAFCHWYSIMKRPPFNGRFDNRSLESFELKDLIVLTGVD